MNFATRLQHAWNAFTGKDSTNDFYQGRGQSYGSGYGSGFKPDRVRLSVGNERTIVTSIYNRIAMDVAATEIMHVRLDDNDRYKERLNTGLNECLTIEANKDQTSRAFIMDVVLSMFDEGQVAVVPVDTDLDPTKSTSYDIRSMRTAKILQWYPDYVQLELYDDRDGIKKQITLPKRMVALIENPFYSIMNEKNSTLQRLIRKLTLLDLVDEQTSSGKLDIIIQLPYVIKTEQRRQQAEERRKDIEMQLRGSKYGIAYTDGTEHITQLNRPAENNLLDQIKNLQETLYSQLGITLEILNGTADEEAMLNYYDRVIEPILAAICDEFKRKFLTKTARSQRQSIFYFRDPFKLVPASKMAEIADKFTRNAIMSSNEIRQVVGMKPSDDPTADELRNKNLNAPNGMEYPQEQNFENQNEVEDVDYESEVEDVDYESDLNAFDDQLDELEELLEHSELYHYASPYYDPVKAHEYYEAHKKLKGRSSTAGLNEEGKAAAKYVKDQLVGERKSKVASHKNYTTKKVNSNNERTKSTIAKNSEKMKKEIESHKLKMQSSIDNLRNYLKSLKPEDKARIRDRVKEQIAKLRSDNASVRDKLRSSNRTESEKLRTNNKQTNSGLRSKHTETAAKLKTQYDEKYYKELDKIRNTEAFKRVPKRKSKQ